jgi:GT2 family glycosyltransferase
MDLKASTPLTSIVIAVYNQLAYTKQCLEAIHKSTLIPFELIIIDNSSSDGTAEFLKGVNASVITNETNQGCAIAWNQGIKISRGLYVVILNNDVLVTPGWLDALIQFIEGTGHGIVSPSVREGNMNYDLLNYSKSFTEICRRAWRPDVSGCCMLIRRSVFDQIGLFDEQFFVGHEDTDFIWRCKSAGFTIGMTGSALVHHFSQTTQNQIKADGQRDYGSSNAAKFLKKWGRSDKGTRVERLINRVRKNYWFVSEKLRYGHTLIEK